MGIHSNSDMAYRRQPAKTSRRDDVRPQVEQMLYNLDQKIAEVLGARAAQGLAAYKGIGRIDDNVNRYAREQYQRAADGFGDSLGGNPRAALELGGAYIHGDRNRLKPGSYVASRALQAGGLTAAGATLMDLADGLTDETGEVGNEQQRLYM